MIWTPDKRIVTPRKRQGGFLLNPFRFGGGGGGDTDPSWDDVTSLLSFDGSDGSTTITDHKSPTWTASGTAQLDTAQSKFSGSSLLLDGNSDYITSDSILITDPTFTVEGWIRLAGNGVRQTIFTQYFGSDGARTIFDIWDGDVLRIFNGDQGSATGSTALSTGQWYFVQFIGDDGNDECKAYLDGSLEATLSPFSRPQQIEARYGSLLGTQRFFNGWLDDFRVTDGVARSPGVPTEAFPAQ